VSLKIIWGLMTQADFLIFFFKDDIMTFSQLGLVPKREGSMSNIWRKVFL